MADYQAGGFSLTPDAQQTDYGLATSPDGWLSGILYPCSGCAAPAVIPMFPAGWSIDLIEVGPPEGPVRTYVTPHLPGCQLTVTVDGQLRDPARTLTQGTAINLPASALKSVAGFPEA